MRDILVQFSASELLKNNIYLTILWPITPTKSKHFLMELHFIDVQYVAKTYLFLEINLYLLNKTSYFQFLRHLQGLF